MTEISDLLMICSHGRPEFRKNAQADTKSPDFLMILIISIKSSQSPQNAGIFHSQYPCLRTCVCYLSRYSYSTVYVKYAPFLGDKFLFVYPEGSISAKNICSCDRPVLRLKTIYLAVLYIFRTNQSLLNEGL